MREKTLEMPREQVTPKTPTGDRVGRLRLDPTPELPTSQFTIANSERISNLTKALDGVSRR